MPTAPSPRPRRAAAPADDAVAARRRLSTGERESQIVAGAVTFFAERGLDGQLRDLARDIGITHALLYHYFPTKQALIDRVYHEVFEGRWNPAWEQMLDDPALTPEDKFIRFYCAYGRAIFQREWVRIFIFSGLSDRSIPDRFFALLRDKLFPRLVREMRRHCGVVSRAKPTQRELELLMGLHGGIFYNGIRRWVYGQPVHGGQDTGHDEVFVRDRVRSFLAGAAELVAARGAQAGAATVAASPGGVRDHAPQRAVHSGPDRAQDAAQDSAYKSATPSATPSPPARTAPKAAKAASPRSTR